MRVETPSEQLLFSTVRIETTTKQGTATGTAFIYNHIIEGERNALFLVTNKHVIEGAGHGKFFFTEAEGGKPKIGARFDIDAEDFESHWFGHSDPDVDLAVLPLVPVLKQIEAIGKSVFFKAIPSNIIPTLDQIEQLDALEEVIIFGYPNGVFDSANLLPVMRRGVTATPLQIDYEGKQRFLVDASIFPGSSGSPVFICNSGGYANRGNFNVGTRVYFLGVISAVLIRRESGSIDFVDIPTTLTPTFSSVQMIDLGVVFKSSLVDQLTIDFLKQSGEI